MIKLLHAADLHLCSPLAAFSPRVAAARRERQFAALAALFAQAVARGAQMILLAGDVFDSPTPPPEGIDRFFAIVRAQPVPVLVAPGNHDPLREGGVWQRGERPANLHVFDSPQLTCLDFPTLGASVYGYAFTAENMPSPALGDGTGRAADRTTILLAHGDLNAPLSPYAPIGAGQLERSGFAYAALGHIHRPMPPCRYGRTVVAYSGFFAGRGFDETGAGQALFVEIEGEYVGTQCMHTACDRFERLELDCTGATDGAQIAVRLQERLREAAFSAETAVSVVLTGQVGLACRVNRTALQTAGEGFALFEVRDQTVPILDSGYLEKDPTLRGAFYRALLPRLTDGDGEVRALAAEALRMGLSALSGGEV